MTTPATPIDSKAVAAELKIDAKALRVFLRAIGYEKTDGRYAFTKTQVTSLKKQYATWEKERAAARKAKADERAKALADAAEKVADVTAE
ncbi:hypothetical protein PP404_25100 [Mycobacteroides abscessus]|nr:hypothetical protein [Mycobacteroides abscessus]MDM2180501.1 hypothetical protein [Mycobacteroides abscessus]MDM2209717.1 hypothetical protein [Mycobacteroides abscessus]MDM2214743.1 hypothetical protein [Mycobacteroides abscessus]MDM2219734.1 hypothetical protein [Mycobacteroides abscessus]